MGHGTSVKIRIEMGKKILLLIIFISKGLLQNLVVLAENLRCERMNMVYLLGQMLYKQGVA